MPQQSRISRDLIFVGDAKHGQNVNGPMHEKMHHFHDHFDQISVDAANWTMTIPDSNDSIAISAGVGGLVLLTGGDADDDSIMLGSQLIFEAAKNCICEAKIKVDTIADTACFFGFADAIAYSNNAMAIAYDGNSQTHGATNAVGFLLDVDATTLGGDEWLCVAEYGSEATAFSSGVTAADGTWVTLRIELDGSTTYATASFYINDVHVGGFIGSSSAGAVTSTTDLCVGLHAENRGVANCTVYADYIDCWQDEN